MALWSFKELIRKKKIQFHIYEPPKAVINNNLAVIVDILIFITAFNFY